MASSTPTAPTNAAASNLAWIAYTDSDYSYVVEDDFAYELKQVNAAGNGPWTLVWGPTFNDGVVLYAAQGQDGSLAVSFRGTNPAFLTGVWLNLEADVNTNLITWQFPQTLNANITAGTNSALALAIASTDPSNGKTLFQYLCERDYSDNRYILITGHSLGGALANVAAMWLYDQLPRYSVTATIYPITFAAPTISDQSFQTAYNTNFPDYSPMVNTNDIVPMAWNNISGMQASFTGPTDDGQTYPTMKEDEYPLYKALDFFWLFQNDYYPLGTANTFTVNPTPLTSGQTYPTWPQEVVLMHSMQNVYYNQVNDVDGPNLRNASTLIATGLMPEAKPETKVIAVRKRAAGPRPHGHSPA